MVLTCGRSPDKGTSIPCHTHAATVLHALQTVCHLTKRKKADNGRMVEFIKVYWFRFSRSNPRKVFLKYSFRETESWTVLSLAKRGAQLKPSHQLHLKYSGPVKIDEKKLQDLQRLLPFVPRAHHTFYNTLTSENNETSDTDAEYCDSDLDD